MTIYIPFSPYCHKNTIPTFIILYLSVLVWLTNKIKFSDLTNQKIKYSLKNIKKFSKKYAITIVFLYKKVLKILKQMDTLYQLWVHLLLPISTYFEILFTSDFLMSLKFVPNFTGKWHLREGRGISISKQRKSWSHLKCLGYGCLTINTTSWC